MTEVRPAGAGPTGPLAGRNHRRAAVLVLVGTALVALVADIATKNLALAALTAADRFGCSAARSPDTDLEQRRGLQSRRRLHLGVSVHQRRR